MTWLGLLGLLVDAIEGGHMEETYRYTFFKPKRIVLVGGGDGEG